MQNHPQITSSKRLTLSRAIQKFCDEWLCANDRSPKTIRAYRIDLGQFDRFQGIRSRRLKIIGPEDVLAWVSALQRKKASSATIKRKLAALRSFFGYAQRLGLVAVSPLSGLRLQLGEVRRVTRVIPEHQLRRLLANLRSESLRGNLAPPARFVAVRNYAIVRLLSATGIRVGELTDLTVASVDLQRQLVTVMGKGRRERIVPLAHSHDVQCLSKYLRARSGLCLPSDSLFVNRSGQPLTTDAVRALVKKMAIDAGLTLFATPHLFRHTAATRLLENGADMRVVQVFLGHQSIRTTERYTHVNVEHLKRVIQRCHPLRRRAA